MTNPLCPSVLQPPPMSGEHIMSKIGKEGIDFYALSTQDLTQNVISYDQGPFRISRLECQQGGDDGMSMNSQFVTISASLLDKETSRSHSHPRLSIGAVRICIWGLE